MNKGLEAIISLRNRLVEKGIKDQFLEELIAIEKELKALEIIKNKNVSAYGIKYTKNVYDYNLSYASKGKEQLTKEEYDLLIEVFCD